MVRFIVGTLVTSVALFMWGFVVWGGAIPFQEMVWKKPVADSEAGSLLKKQFPENGVYIYPPMTGDMEADEKRHQAGPIAFVHMLRVDGRPMMDTSIMIGGFILNTVFVALVAGLLWSLRESLCTYKSRFILVAAFGLIAAVFINIGDAIWWQIDLKWKLYQAFYTLSACMLTGAILAAFVPKGRQVEPVSQAPESST